VPVAHACTDPGNSEPRNVFRAISITNTISVVRANDVSPYNAKPAVLDYRVADSNSHRFPERRFRKLFVHSAS
jgi:hypothetical protein